MESGGVSKSMSSLVNTIDTDKYAVDLLVVNPVGIFMNSIPKEINLITEESNALFLSSFPANMPKLLKKGYLKLFVMRFFSALFMKINRGWAGWILSRGIKPLQKEYDLAVDFNGQQQLYYLVDKIKAKKKVSFFHSDYAKWGFYYGMDKRYYPKVDRIFTISETCVQAMKRYFPDQEDNIKLFENISNEKFIQQMALESIEDIGENAIISVGHLSEKKGTPLAFQSAEVLKDRGVKFKWYFLGYNTRDYDYESIINQKQLRNHIVLLGIKANPYPYIKQADIVVHPSQFEGKSIALDEAKILAKPIVVTNFSTVSDQFENRVNATICAMDEISLADAIEELLGDEKLRNRYMESLKKQSYNNTSEIEKLYKLITG